MRITIDEPGVEALLSNNAALAQWAALISSEVTVDNQIHIRTSGHVALSIQISTSGGALVLNITSATAYGMSLFGMVRAKAGQTLLAYLAKLPAEFQSVKNAQGNISLSWDIALFADAQCVAGAAIVTLQRRPPTGLKLS